MSDSIFVMQRTTAHAEIPGNAKWILDRQCYACDRWKYTLFFSKTQQPVTGSF
jgi:hypothetical protein